MKTYYFATLPTIRKETLYYDSDNNNSAMFNIKNIGVIFDLDGLIIDTESTYYAAWQKAAQLMGYHLKDKFCLSLSGLSSEQVSAQLIALFGSQFNTNVFNSLSASAWHELVGQQGISVKDGFIDFLAYLKAQNIPFCIATNSDVLNARYCLQLAGLSQAFTILISRDMVEHGKPHPDIFLMAAKALELPITSCLVLEDSLTGIIAAKRAGAMTVFIPSTPKVDRKALVLCDIHFNNLIELLALFKKLNATDDS